MKIICLLLGLNVPIALGSSFPQSISTQLISFANPAFVSISDDVKLSEGARLLFSSKIANWYTKQQLSFSEKMQIYQQLDLTISPDKQELHPKSDKDLAYPLLCTVDIIDLNNDGKLEVMVSVYHHNWTGQGGTQTIFGKDSSGKFHKILEAQGAAELLTTSFGGYPDILLAGPGFVFPTQRWNGTKYQFYKRVSFEANNSPQMVTLEDFYKKTSKK